MRVWRFVFLSGSEMKGGVYKAFQTIEDVTEYKNNGGVCEMV